MSLGNKGCAPILNTHVLLQLEYPTGGLRRMSTANTVAVCYLTANGPPVLRRPDIAIQAIVSLNVTSQQYRP